MDELERIASISSWEELQRHFTLEQVKAALRDRERNRLYHKKQYLKKQAIFERVKKEHPELFEEK